MSSRTLQENQRLRIRASQRADSIARRQAVRCRGPHRRAMPAMPVPGAQRGRREFRDARPCARLGAPCRRGASMSQANPIRLFVTHTWETSDDYLRVFEYLESARNFFYRNYSTPEQRPGGDKEAQREDLRRQIAPTEAVIALSSLFQTH